MAKEKLDKFLRYCTVRIESYNSRGTGFFVAPGGWILTCEHVVSEGNTVSVSWTDNERQYKKTASVEARLPIPIDLALLKIRETVPEHQCVYIDNKLPKRGDQLLTFGYPVSTGTESYSDGDSVTTEYEGGSYQNGLTILKLKEGQIEEGFSGAALLNDRNGKVCGIVSISRGLLGGRATPSEVLFHLDHLVNHLVSAEDAQKITRIIESNKNYHANINRNWSRILREKYWERSTALVVAILSACSFAFIYFYRPDSQITLAIVRLLLSFGFGYSTLLYIKSLDISIFKEKRFPAGAISGFLATIVTLTVSLVAIPEKSIVFRNLTGVNDYPVLGLVEGNIPLPLKSALDIISEPIIDENNIYRAIETFKNETGNSSLISDYRNDYERDEIGFSSRLNSDGKTTKKVIDKQKNDYDDDISQDTDEFESEPGQYIGEYQKFNYTNLLMPFQNEVEDASWTAVARSGSTGDIVSGSVIQYPYLSTIKEKARFPQSVILNDSNTWFNKVIDENPNVRGFIGYQYRFFSALLDQPEQYLSYLFSCGYSGIVELSPSPYVRFLDLENRSSSSIRIESIRTKSIEKSSYELTPILNRKQIFQEAASETKPYEVSIPPDGHLFVPVEFGFDTRSAKNSIVGEYGSNSSNSLTPDIQSTGYLFNEKSYISKIPPIDKEDKINRPLSYDDFDVNSYFSSVSVDKNFIASVEKASTLFEKIPNRYALGSFNDIVSVRANGEDIEIDSLLNDPRFALSVYFKYGSCPYLMVYDSQKGYWVEVGTVLTGKDSERWKGSDIHNLGRFPNKIRIEEREREISYIDALSILFTDEDTGEEHEVYSSIPTLNKLDEEYLTLHQGDSIEIDLLELIPASATQVKLKTNGYYKIIEMKNEL